MAPAGDSYDAEKAWAIAIVLVLAVVAGGVLVPFVARARMRTIARELSRASDPAEQERLRARLAAAKLRSEQSPFSLLLGDDQRLSTSKTIAWLWTLVVAFILVALVLVWPSDWTKALSNLAPNYLLLLGGPYAAYIFAKASVTAKVNRGTLQKPAGDGTPRLSDLVGDDAGRTDLNDAQYVIFNLIAMAFVVDAFWRATTGGFPPIPAGLILLTGGPAAVFAANKALAANMPVVSSVFPPAVRPGDRFTIYGQNFTPGGSDPADGGPVVFAAVDGVAASIPPGGATENSIVAIAPATSTPGQKTVSVATLGGQSVVKNEALEVRAPLLTGLSAAVAAPGAPITASGVWSSADGARPVLLVDGVVAPFVSEPQPGCEAVYTVPPLAPGHPPTVDVTLAVGTLASDPRQLDVT